MPTPTSIPTATPARPRFPPRPHALAETRQGYANLCRLVSLANGWGLAEQADRERRRRDPCAALRHVREHTAGVVCLTGGRRGGAGPAGHGR